MTSAQNGRRDAGFALPLTLLIALAVVAMGMAAAMIGTAAAKATQYYAREDVLDRAADAGLELARAKLNADGTLFPDSGYTAIENNAPAVDASGTPIPGVTRTTYIGPVGVTTGQYGVYGAIVSVARDAGGAEAVRRLNLSQESFSKFAYFTDVEPSDIAFGGGDQIYGPVHTNDYLKIWPSGATFFGPVTTAKTVESCQGVGSCQAGGQYATFKSSLTQNATYIPMPKLADLTKLKTQADQGGTDFTGDTSAPWGEATTRIEFVPVDLNGDGNTTGANEGFMRVYQSSDAQWVVGGAPAGNLRNSRTCGHWHSNGTFVSAANHPASGPDSWSAALSSSTRRCYLGGAPELFGGFTPNDGTGHWLPYGGTVSPLLSGRPDANYLFPITRQLNPNFKGVIYVNGDVAISGVVRGRVTVVATGNIIIADDVTYATDPSVGSCADILGLFAGGDIIMADNPINSPWQRGTGNSYFTYDDTPDEFVDAFVLTLNEFTAQNYLNGSRKDQPCQGTPAGRGCLYLTGGIIQETRGPVGAGYSNGNSGYIKRYSYDACGATQPPPYFPTTGRFMSGTYYEVSPNGFSPGAYFQMLTAG